MSYVLYNAKLDKTIMLPSISDVVNKLPIEYDARCRRIIYGETVDSAIINVDDYNTMGEFSNAIGHRVIEILYQNGWVIYKSMNDYYSL